MADLSQTPANVGLSSANDVNVQIVKVGEAVTQGQPGYRLASDGLYYQTDANASEAAAAAKGIFLTPAATSEYAVFAGDGSTIDLGATLTVGTAYYVSVTKGAIADAAPVSGGYNTVLGIADTTSSIKLKINASGSATP